MKKKTRIKEFEKMYKSLTDPDEIQKVIRKESLKKMKEDKMKDTGL